MKVDSGFTHIGHYMDEKFFENTTINGNTGKKV